jgi:hypothetical protein
VWSGFAINDVLENKARRAKVWSGFAINDVLENKARRAKVWSGFALEDCDGERPAGLHIMFSAEPVMPNTM